MSQATDRPDLYRRRRSAVPHRRRPMWVKLVRPLMTALALVGLPALGAYWAATTPYLHIAHVDVSPTERVSAAWVRETLRPLEGEHLLWIGLPEVERRLASNEWIEEIAVRKQLPDRLIVAIEERRPAAILRLRGDLFFVQRDAAVIAEYDERLLAEPLLVLDAPTGSEYEVAPALDLAAEWRRIDPAWSGTITEIEIVSDEDFRVHVDGLAFPVMASLEGLEPGLDRLSWLLPELERRYPAIASVDIRFSRQIVFEPAAEPRTREG